MVVAFTGCSAGTAISKEDEAPWGAEGTAMPLAHSWFIG